MKRSYRRYLCDDTVPVPRSTALRWRRNERRYVGQFKPRTGPTVSGLFAPGPFRSRERKFYGWNFRSLEISLRGTFVPWNVRSVELSSPRTFVPKHESSIELSFCGTFVPGTFVSPVRSSAAVSTVGNVIFGYCMNSTTSSTNIYFVLFVQILVYEQ